MRALMIPFLTGLMFAVSGHAQAPDWSHAQPLTIELSSFKFTPATVALEHGTAYRIHFVNKSGGGHDFAAKEFFADSDIAPEDRAKIRSGSIGLGGGESADIRLAPLRAGTFKVHCTHFMHSTFGMIGSIAVR